MIIKQILFLPLLTMITVSVAFGQLETPAASPTGKIEQRVGIMTVVVEYSRPGVKGRTVFGGLVSYGEVWRTGANAPTTVSFSDDVRLEGHQVPAGRYSVYTVPGKQEWTIIINGKTDGGERPDEKEDVVRFNVQSHKLDEMVETFTINVTDIRSNTANLEFAWAQTAVRIGMEFDVDKKVMAQIDKELKNPFSGVAGTFHQAADYYFENGKDLKQALEWVDRSVELRDDAFWVWRLKSRIEAGLKNFDAAIATAKIAKQKAQDAGNNQFVRYNEEAIAEWEKLR